MEEAYDGEGNEGANEACAAYPLRPLGLVLARSSRHVRFSCLCLAEKNAPTCRSRSDFCQNVAAPSCGNGAGRVRVTVPIETRMQICCHEPQPVLIVRLP